MKELRLFYNFMVTHDYWDEYKVARREEWRNKGGYSKPITKPEDFIDYAFYWGDTESGRTEWSDRGTAWLWVLWGFRQAQS